jgi:antirestriction protein ArdC
MKTTTKSVTKTKSKYKYKAKSKVNIKEIMTTKIVETIKAGTIPWERPWNKLAGLPQNAVHKNAYRGGNIMLLWAVSTVKEYDCDRWLTFNQIKKLAGYEWQADLKKFILPNTDIAMDDLFHLTFGERSSTILTPNMVKKYKNKVLVVDKITGKPEMVCIGFKGLPVFNLNQCQNVPAELLATEFFDKGPESGASLEKLMSFAKFMGIKIHEKGTICSYSPSKDIINMSPRISWNKVDDFIATLAHELIHSTGNVHRLNRNGITDKIESMDNPKYAYEELIAEIGASMICMRLGIQYKTRHAAYIEHYLNVINESDVAKTDKKFDMLFKAANEAQDAVDYLFNLTALNGPILQMKLAG